MNSKNDYYFQNVLAFDINTLGFANTISYGLKSKIFKIAVRFPGSGGQAELLGTEIFGFLFFWVFSVI